MKIALRYFTGTGNSLKVLNTCRECFIENGHTVSISAINLEQPILAGSDLIGFSFPVYAFDIPRICRQYLRKLPKFEKRQRVFVLITAGDEDESGFAVRECERILSTKNCELVYSTVIQMPINWTTSPVPPFPQTPEVSAGIIDKGIEKAKAVAEDIFKGDSYQHTFNYPRRYSKFKFYREYYLFKYLGVANLWRTFRVYDSCSGCGLCAKICPTASIHLKDHRPVWASSCEQCMRCVNFCPTESIFQSHGGDTKGKCKYHEPSFKPLKTP